MGEKNSAALSLNQHPSTLWKAKRVMYSNASKRKRGAEDVAEFNLLAFIA